MVKKQKRKKSQGSPDVVSEIQCNKRINMDGAQKAQYPISSADFQNTPINNGNFSDMLNCSPNMQYSRYTNQDNITHNQCVNSPAMMQGQCGYNSPPSYMNLGVPTNTQTLRTTLPAVPPTYNQMVLDKLEALDKRLNKLDTIEAQVKSIHERVASLDTRLTFLETSVHDHGRKLIDIEASRNYDAQVCTELENKNKEIEKCIQSGKNQSDKLSLEFEKLKSENERLSEEVVDLQSRSMRDNLLFFGFSEKSSAEERKSENCRERLVEFFTNTLELDHPENIKLDRVHRIGKFTPGKNRPIVAKFNYYPDKLTVKNVAYDKLQNTDYRVGDQFPRAVQEKRRRLIPELIKAREEGKDAVLVYDRLVIKGRRRPSGNPNNPTPGHVTMDTAAEASGDS
jgi:hypothetical protein